MTTQVDMDIAQVWQAYRAEPTVELRNRLVEHYLPLVKYNAERIWARLPDGVELDDLISAGVFGLMDAIDAFDLNRGVKFETYCVPRIRGAMLDELRTMDWVPRLVRSKASKMEAGPQGARSRARPPAAPDELAEQARHPARQFDEMRRRGDRRQPRQPQQEVVRDGQLQGRPRDRHPRRQEGRRPDAPAPEPRPDAAGHPRPEPQRAAHHHPLLLRRHDDEGDRRDARPERVARQPDALQHRRPAAGPALQAAAGVQRITVAGDRSYNVAARLEAALMARVLVADDNPQNADLLAEYLQASEFEVAIAADGEETLRR